MFNKIGVTAICLGLMMADSECLLVPIAVLALGALLVKIGIDRGELEDKEAERSASDSNRGSKRC